MSVLKPAPAREELVMVESSPAYAEQLSSMGKDRRSAVKGIVALFGLGAAGLLNEACGTDCQSLKLESCDFVGRGDSDIASNGGDYSHGGDDEAPDDNGGDKAPGRGDYDYRGDPEGSRGGDTDNPGDSEGGDTDVDLDGQDCTPEGSRWSPDGECYCAPEGSCSGVYYPPCTDQCAPDANNVCRPPHKWRCF